MRILRDAGLSELIDHGAGLRTLADGFSFTEGPLWLPDGTLLFQDIKAARTYRIAPGGRAEVLREDTRAANGQTFLPDGRIVFCEQDGRRVSVMDRDGTGVVTLAQRFEGRRLNSPNDVVCRADGLVAFTDPPYGVAEADRELTFQGVFRLDPSRPDDGPRLVADGFEKPNGLAFAPDGRTLYVCDTGRYHVRAMEIDPDGGAVSGSFRTFATVDPDEPGGPDGIKVDADGRVYVAVAQGVWVFEPAGALLGVIALSKRPSNLAWCDGDARGLAVTAGDTVYTLRLKVAGLAPPFTHATAGGPSPV